MPSIDTPKLYRASKAKHGHQSSQPFKMAHQRVSVDVDLANHAVSGSAEVVIVPFSDKLKVVKLDCREMDIERVTVNGDTTCNYIYDDDLYLNDDEYFENTTARGLLNLLDVTSPDVSIHHHHLIRQKLNKVFGELNFDPRELAHQQHQITAREGPSTPSATPSATLHQQQVQQQLQQQQQLFLQQFTTAHANTGELAIFLPENFRFSAGDGTPQSVAMTTPAKKNTPHAESYAPITFTITYSLKNPKNGVQFVTPESKEKWHCFTSNADYGVSTSSWVPCVDNLWERCTWSVEMSIPRTLQPRIEDEDEEEEEESGELDLVVCCGDTNNVKETPHPSDRSKKVVSWSLFNPVCAQHVGWAVGCFSSFVLKSDDVAADDDEPVEEIYDSDDEDGGMAKGEPQSNPVTVYCFSSDLELARNTCVVTNRAMDFFSAEFGSFPFSSLSMVFVSELDAPVANFAGLVVADCDLLYPSDVIEPMISSTEIVVEAIACQWSGINIVPHSFGDLWATVGIARYMMYQYLKVLMGANEYKFRVKMAMEEICQKDVNQKPLALRFYRFPVRSTDLAFVKLKAPIVMIILDRRMTKTDKSFGLSRVLPKLFLQAMSGDLYNGSLSTQHFQYVCEKVNRTNKLEGFFKQWIFGAGTPRFYVTQRFNKKRFLIEMTIRQVQTKEVSKYRPTAENFVDDAIAFLDDEPAFSVQPVFTGPMTIRVHEQDGTPYEHIVDLKDSNTRIDIQYNTKMRRKMKSRKKDKGGEESDEEAPMPQLGARFTPLGSEILQKPSEMAEWGFENWQKTEEELFDNAFEWVRVDADLEWIAQFEIKKPDYMYGSQLAFDRDVEAQYDAIRHFGRCERPLPQVYASLTRTFMDPAYYYGVRVAAAQALVDISNEGNQFLGVGYMVKAYKEMFCYPQSSIPLSNDFNDFSRFFVQKAVPKLLAAVRNVDGDVPKPIKTLLFNLVKYNDNSNNSFDDAYYVSELVTALTRSALSPTPPDDSALFHWLSDPTPGISNTEQRQFVNSVETELRRLYKLDEWVPSYHNVVAVACLRQKIDMAVRGLVEFPLDQLLFYTLDTYPDAVRLEAWRGVFLMGGLRNATITEHFTHCLLLASDANATGRRRFQTALVAEFMAAVAVAAIAGTRGTLDDPEFGTLAKLAPNSTAKDEVVDQVIIDTGDGAAGRDRRRDAIAKASIKGSIDILRRDYAQGHGLRNLVWELLHTSLLPLHCRRDIFVMAQILYPEHDELIVKLPVPSTPVAEFKKKIVVRNHGDGEVVFKREGRFKIQLLSRKPPTIKLRGSPSVEAEPAPTPHLSREERALLREAQLNKSTPVPAALSGIGPRLVAVNGTTVQVRSAKLKSLPAVDQPGVISSAIATRTDTTEVAFSFVGQFKDDYRAAVVPRYVKIDTKAKKLTMSREPFEANGVTEDKPPAHGQTETDAKTDEPGANGDDEAEAIEENGEQIKEEREKSPEKMDVDEDAEKQETEKKEPAKPKIKLKLSLKK
ncbi:transcription initiation factor TFIID subunit 2 [Diutina catenulata]